MNKILGFFFLLFSLSISAQELPPPGKIDREHRREFRRDLKEYERSAPDSDRWDIVIPPIESVPTEKFDIRTASTTNWGRNLLLPQGIWQEVRDRAKGRVVIKVGDTGGTSEHPDLQRNLLPGSNYTTSPGLPDVHGHATHVAGIVAARGFGLADPLFDKGLASLKLVKVLNDNGSGTFSGIAAAIEQEDAQNMEMIAQGARVLVNFSLGGGTALIPVVEAALKQSVERGVVYVCAAGNSGGPVEYPGRSPHTFATSSLDENLQLSSFSSRGEQVDHAAPGRGITSTWPGGGYATLSGTSMASPFLTSLAAIAMSIYPEYLTSQEDVRAYFQRIGQDLGNPGRDDWHGWGLVYVRKILDTPPVDEPQEPVRGWRLITYPLDGPFNILWTAGQNQPAVVGADVLNFYRDVLNEQVNTLTISGLDIQVRTNRDAAPTWDRLKQHVTDFFISRGLLLDAGSDYRDAAYWASYFLDMHLDKENGMNITVKRINATEEGGRPVSVVGAELKHWQPTLDKMKPPAEVKE